MIGVLSRMSVGAAAIAAVALLAASGALGAGGVDHSAYDAFLKDHTRDGLVDYGAVKKDLPRLETYLKGLTDSSAAYYESWDRGTRMAFWINAYNAVTLYAVAVNHPIRVGENGSKKRIPENSIMQVKDVWETAYVELAGRSITLNAIRDEVLRREFGDPRIHFALVSASVGSPLLSEDAYTGDAVDEQLERDAVRFVNHYDRARVNKTRGRLYVSEIFEWYAEDFTLEGEESPEWVSAYKKKTRGFVRFIAARVDGQTRAAIEKRNLKVTYLDYDWSLNEIAEED